VKYTHKMVTGPEFIVGEPVGGVAGQGYEVGVGVGQSSGRTGRWGDRGRRGLKEEKGEVEEWGWLKKDRNWGGSRTKM
jgi:hypothetical protein